MEETAAVGMASSEATTAAAPPAGPERKKRRTERRELLRKSALCKHFDKPGGCPFPNCKFAHGRPEVQDAGVITIAAQRKLIREQATSRNEDKFLAGASASTASLRGTMIERYYTELFSCDTMNRAMEDQYVHMHSNRLCVVGVAASHPMLVDEIEAVEFSSAVRESKVTGKKKRGGHFLLPGTVLCHVKCKSGKAYALRSCIRGSLIEVNERLLARPQLLQEKAHSDGYLVIIQPKLDEIAEIQQSLLSKAEYQQFRSLVAATSAAAADTEMAAAPDAATESGDAVPEQ
ncbi:hypothetical protein PybrP1_009093 [[Pythium] brassicae (nom. inval.)]|nr:hypothetical protein PybrP1_009093 [[Pythium] brassicae (nom. inval.)]